MIQPKWRARVATAFATAAEANTTIAAMTVQCRAGSDSIQGAAISRAPNPI